MEWTPQQDGLREILTLLKESQSPDTATQLAVQQVSFSLLGQIRAHCKLQSRATFNTGCVCRPRLTRIICRLACFLFYYYLLKNAFLNAIPPLETGIIE